MKVTWKNKDKTETLEDLEYGTVFHFPGCSIPYMKLDENDEERNDLWICANLENGVISRQYLTEKVVPVEAELVIS